MGRSAHRSRFVRCAGRLSDGSIRDGNTGPIPGQALSVFSCQVSPSTSNPNCGTSAYVLLNFAVGSSAGTPEFVVHFRPFYLCNLEPGCQMLNACTNLPVTRLPVMTTQTGYAAEGSFNAFI